MMRLAARVDSNQAEIVEALRKAGMTVVDVHGLGGRCLDILVGYANRNYLFEIKTPGGRLTNCERDFMATWQGQATVIRTAEDAFKVMLEDE